MRWFDAWRIELNRMKISQEISLNDSELTLEHASTSNPAPNYIEHK